MNAELPVTLLESTGARQLLAIGVSPRGMFVKTDAPSPLRRLVRLRVPVSDDGQELQVLAMVVHRVLPVQSKAAKSPPGMGVQLYGLGPVARQRWQDWVERLIERYGQADERATEPPPPPVLGVGKRPLPIDAIKRRNPRFDVRWEVRIIGEGVETTVTRDISVGGAFIFTKGAYDAGAEVDLVLLHPDSGDGFDISARVTRYEARGPNESGIGVAFLALEADRRDALVRFIESGLPDETDDSLMILDADDPHLA